MRPPRQRRRRDLVLFRVVLAVAVAVAAAVVVWRGEPPSPPQPPSLLPLPAAVAASAGSGAPPPPSRRWRRPWRRPPPRWYNAPQPQPPLSDSIDGDDEDDPSIDDDSEKPQRQQQQQQQQQQQRQYYYDRRRAQQQQRPTTRYDLEDMSAHFLDRDEWMLDERSRLFRVDLKSRRPNRLSLTSRIVVGTCAAFVAQAVRPDFTAWGMKLSDEILSGKQLYRLLTPVFLHGGIFHLFTNMYSLQQVGNDVERIFGPGRFLATYVVSGVAGNLLSAYKSPNPSLGASGSVFGTVASYFVFLTRNEWLLGSAGEAMSLAIAQTLLANVALGMVNPMIDNWAHLGGAIGGAAVAWYFGPRLYLSELPDGGRILIDRPVLRLPRAVESIPERVSDRFARISRRMRVERYKLDMPEKPWRPRQRQRRNYRRDPGNRSIKPKL